MRLWNVYLPDLKPALPGSPFWKHVASCQTVEAREAAVRLLGRDAAWAEVST